jgi:hypothetical protein
MPSSVAEAECLNDSLTAERCDERKREAVVSQMILMKAMFWRQA